MVPFETPARAAICSMRAAAKPLSAKTASAASRISWGRASLRRRQRTVSAGVCIFGVGALSGAMAIALITDQSFIYLWFDHCNGRLNINGRVSKTGDHGANEEGANPRKPLAQAFGRS